MHGRRRGLGDVGGLRNSFNLEMNKVNLLNKTIETIQPQNQAARAQAKGRLDQLTMPHWAMGRLMDLAMDLAGITGSTRPAVARKAIITMAGDHGVAAEGVSKYPQEVTAQMVG